MYATWVIDAVASVEEVAVWDKNDPWHARLLEYLLLPVHNVMVGQIYSAQNIMCS